MQETVPPAETRRRVGQLQGLMSAKGIPLALIRQPADLFYYTGTVADGFLAVPAAGEPRFLVRRPQERLAAAEIPWELTFYRDHRELPALLDDLAMSPASPLGVELDVLPAALYLRLHNQIFPRDCPPRYFPPDPAAAHGEERLRNRADPPGGSHPG